MDKWYTLFFGRWTCQCVKSRAYAPQPFAASRRTIRHIFETTRTLGAFFRIQKIVLVTGFFEQHGGSSHRTHDRRTFQALDR